MKSTLIVLNKGPLIKAITTFISAFIISYIAFTIIGVNFESTEIIEFQTKEIFFNIFINNVKVYLILFLGLFLFRIPTYLTLIFNAYLLGFAFAALDNITTALAILVHGVFEMTAFLIATTIAFNNYKYVMENKKPFGVFFLIGIVFLLVGAIIETYISPIILKGI